MMSKIRRITNSVAYPKNLKIKEGATYFPKKISDLIHFQDFSSSRFLVIANYVYSTSEKEVLLSTI